MFRSDSAEGCESVLARGSIGGHSSMREGRGIR